VRRRGRPRDCFRGWGLSLVSTDRDGWAQWIGDGLGWRRRRVGSEWGGRCGGGGAAEGRALFFAGGGLCVLWVGVGGRGMRGGRGAIALGGVLPNQKPGSGPAGKQANGVSKALLRRVNRERGEVAYRACCLLLVVVASGETAEEPGGWWQAKDNESEGSA
jgi:hypothetical protein